ncbi:hypothetical protein BGZ76_003462 [Entomortierella beljakovae]|nr:hypothetical protein BGZ76_003462 [Entomortierella beljakovae]
MYYYHLKLDLYTNNLTHSSSNSNSKSQLQTSVSSDTSESTATTRFTNSSVVLSAATCFRNILKPFPLQQSLHKKVKDTLPETEQLQKEICKSSVSTAASVSELDYITLVHPYAPEDYRLGQIEISSIDEQLPGPTKEKSGSSKNKSSKNKKATASASTTPLARGSVKDMASHLNKNFQSSEPVEGILRLYKDTNEITTGKIQIQSGQNEELTSTSSAVTVDRERDSAQVIHPEHGTTVCVLAVPSYMSPGDFLNFVGPVRSNVSHFRIIRDAVPNRFMVLMKFRSSDTAFEFYNRYNGKAFSSLEAEICHVVYLKSIEIRAGSMPPYAFPFINDDPFLQNNHPVSPVSSAINQESGQDSTEAVDSNRHVNNSTSPFVKDQPGVAELPTCPVCLERLDSTVTGLLTIFCQHTFHCHCISKWGEGSCPVCRYSQKSVKKTALDLNDPDGDIASTDGVNEDQNVCATCGTTENLWICLICGHIGCGRYQEKHAYHHYDVTSHLYALELETQRVWDYAGDGYVHRLIQNKADGKLVELPSAVNGALRPHDSSQIGQEKLDAIGVEYTYLLTSQLESQRLYFDAQMAALTAQLTQVNKDAKEWEKEAALLNERNRELMLMSEVLEKEKLPSLVREKKASEKRLEKMQEKLQQMEQRYEEEKEMNVGLRTNQDSFKVRLQEKEAEIQDLQEQVRDMMIYLDTQQKIEASPIKDELVGGTIEVVAPTLTSSSSASPSGGPRRKGRK